MIWYGNTRTAPGSLEIEKMVSYGSEYIRTQTYAKHREYSQFPGRPVVCGAGTGYAVTLPVDV